MLNFPPDSVTIVRCQAGIGSGNGGLSAHEAFLLPARGGWRGNVPRRVGLYVIAQAFRMAPAAFAMQPAGHPHHHHHERAHHNEAHAGCACGHSHKPEASAVASDWSLAKAVSLAFAVGLRPCTGAILALLFSSAIGLYWAGIASIFAMALGTAMTVSAIAVLAVSSRRLALRLAGRDSRRLSVSVFGLKLAGGLVIAGLGGLLFWASLAGGPGVS